jgi:hypothetical protein
MCEFFISIYPVRKSRLGCPSTRMSVAYEQLITEEIPRTSDPIWVSYNVYIVFCFYWIMTNVFYKLFSIIWPDRLSVMNDDQRKSCSMYFIPVFIFAATLCAIAISKPFR